LELAPRSDGARYRRVTLEVDPDGTIALNVLDLGAGVGAEWGLDEDEVSLSVPPEQVRRLALALAAEVLKGGEDAVKKLATVCEANDVPCRIARWS
jgi:hypothetical protein